MNERITLSGVPETMLQTLYARAKESRTRGAVCDKKAEEIVERLDYDFSSADKDMAMRSGVIARTIVLDRLVQAYLAKTPGAIVVNIACGLDTRCYRMRGYSIYGQDFSSRMIALASEKMPDAHLYQGDFSKGLVEPLRNRRYDYIVATYSLHHLTDEQKRDFLLDLRNYLKENGKIIIGDVAFETREDLEQCKLQAGDTWDNDEIYFVIEELRKDFPGLSFIQMSDCAGVLMLD